MPAGKYNIEVEAGAGLTLRFAFTDQNGDPIPFAEGTTAEFQARTVARAPGRPILRLTEDETEHGSITVDAADGIVWLHMTDEGTRLFDKPDRSPAVYAIEVYEPDKDTRRFVEGRITCLPEIVRPVS